MRVLAGGPERVFPGATVIIANGSARFHRVGNQPVVGEIECYDTISCFQRGFGFCLVTKFPVKTCIVWGFLVNLRCIEGLCCCDIWRGLQNLIINLYQFSRGFRLKIGFSDDHGHMVSHIPDSVEGEDRVGTLLHGTAVF